MNDKTESFFKLFFKGFCVGIGTLIPGVSGGTVAILLGVYEHLLKSFGDVFINLKQSARYLMPFALGGVAGIYLFSKFMSDFCLYFPTASHVVFCIITIISISLFYVFNIKHKSSLRAYFPCAAGIIFSLLIDNLIKNNTVFVDIDNYFAVLTIGVILSIALILPGVSFSYMLLFFNLYQTTLNAIETLNLWFILMLGTGILIGSFVFSKLFIKLTDRYHQQTYSFIFGFVLFSAFQMLTNY